MSTLTKFVIGIVALVIIGIFGPALVGVIMMILQGGHP